MSWFAILALAIGVAGQRLIGMFWAGPILAKRPFLSRLSDLLPAAVIAGVIVQLTFTTSEAQLTIDARAAGLAAACFMVWRRAPLYLVVLVAAGATALVRLLA